MTDLWLQKFRVERQLTGAQIIPFGVKFLDEALRGIFPTDIVLLGARTGAGKTQLATQIALNACRMHKNVWFYALEADKGEIVRRMLFGEVGKLLSKLEHHQKPLFRFRYANYIAGDYDILWGEDLKKLEDRAWKNIGFDCLNLKTIYRDKGFTVKDFCRSVEAAKVEGAQLIILDHLHYFDWSATASEYEELKNAVKLIRDLALKHEIPIVLIAHLRKKDRGSKAIIPDIDDFHGSSDISKIATKAIMLARAPMKTASGKTASYLYIAKARTAGDAMYYAGVVAYDRNTGSYDDKYVISKVNFGEPEIITDKKEIPSWTVNVNIPTES